MNERGWFTLLVRGLGLLFTLLALRSAAGLGANLLVAWFNTPRNQAFTPLTGTNMSSYTIAQGLTALVPLGAGLYLLFGGGRMIDWLCKSVVGRCVACGHRLAGDEPACPECGVRSRPAS